MLWYTPCLPWVTDPAGNVVFMPLCIEQVVAPFEPGQVVVSHWDQRDTFGQQVPPGVYFVGGVPFDLQPSHTTGLLALGDPRVGFTRGFELCSPSDPLAFHVLAVSSTSTTGIALGCGLTFPLDFDALFLHALTAPAVFQGFIGVLDGNGRTSTPRLAVPPLASLAGVAFEAAFAVLDPLAPCGVTRVSGTLPLVVAP